jgi:hypothetical protein
MNAESIGRSISRVELIADPNFSKNCPALCAREWSPPQGSSSDWLIPPRQSAG